MTAISISPIDKNQLNMESSGKIKYFWEPKASTVITKNNADFPQFAPKFTITINKDTLNESKDYSTEKPNDVYRIIALGDSLTYGLYVNTKDNWTKLLENKLNNEFICKKYKKIEVINLGVYAYDPQYEVERYRVRGQKYNPDLVIWFLIQRDSDEINEFMFPRIEKYSISAIKSGAYSDRWKEYGVYYAPAWFKAKSELIQQYGQQEILDYNVSMIRSINNYFDKSLLIVMPSLVNRDYQTAIKQIVSDRKEAYFFDNLSYLNKKNTVFPDNHPNQLGYKMIAQDIYDYITKKGLINCN